MKTYKSSIFILVIMTSGCTLLPPAVDIGLTAAGIGVWSATGKSPTDHTLSYVTDKDCQTVRIVTDDKVCQSSIDKQEAVFNMRSSRGY